MNTKYKTVDIYEITVVFLPNQKIEKRADKTLQTFYGLGKKFWIMGGVSRHHEMLREEWQINFSSKENRV